jgi:Protein of unknown function (DUF4229)
MRATFSYTLLRLALFAVVLGLLYLAGIGGVLLIALAALISGVVSYVLLSRQRDAMSGAMSNRLHSIRSRLDEGARAEDDD